MAAAALAVLFALPLPASAHAELESWSPSGAVSKSPSEMRLRFSEDVTALGSVVVVLDPQGKAVQRGAIRVEGTQLSVGLEPLVTRGTYRVNYRVVSVDGHAVNGSKTFEFRPDQYGAPTPETSVVTSNDPRAAYWITAFLMLCGFAAGLIAWRARR